MFAVRMLYKQLQVIQAGRQTEHLIQNSDTLEQTYTRHEHVTYCESLIRQLGIDTLTTMGAKSHAERLGAG